MNTEIERLSMVGCGWYWKKAGVDELGMLEMNDTPSSIPSAYIGTRAQSPLTPGRLAGRVWTSGRTIHACRRASRQLDEGVCGEKVGYIINFDNTMLKKSRVQDYCGSPNLHGVEAYLELKLKPKKSYPTKPFVTTSWANLNPNSKLILVIQGHVL